MKLLFTCLTALTVSLASPSLRADDLERTNGLSFEVLGRGLLYSVSFDHALSNRFSLGLGYSTFSAGMVNATVLPVYLNFYFYNSESMKHRWFATGGADVITATFSFWGLSAGGTAVAPTAGAGYEFRTEGGFLLRAAVYSVIADSVYVTPGVSVGFAF